MQGHIGRVAELLVAFHLEGGQVEQAGRSFRTFLGRDVRYLEGYLADAFQQFTSGLFVGNGRDSPVFDGLSFLLCRVLLFGFLGQFFVALSDNGGKDRIAVDGLQFPILLGDKMLDFLLALHNQGQGGSLHPPDGEHLFVLSVLQGIEACSVHPQRPVADGTAQSCLVQRLEFGLVFQVCEPVTDGLLGQR